MAEQKQLNTAWLAQLANAHHDGTTQQIDDFVQAFLTDNAVLTQKKATLHQARQTEDEVWLKEQRDAAVPQLEAADRQQDCYITAFRYAAQAHASLPDTEPTQREGKQCLQVLKDFGLSTREAYGSESDKIIQMQQNLQSHQAFLEQIGAWTFLQKAVVAAQEVRQLLGQRAQTKGEFVKGEMKAARRATDLAIADLYKTLMAMQELMPTAELNALITQLKGIELYACQYYLNEGATGGGSGTGTSGGTTSGSGSTSGSGGSTGNVTPVQPENGGTNNSGGGDDEPGGDDH